MNAHKPHRMPRSFWWSLGLGALLLILGAGNLYLGSKRAMHYRGVIQTLKEEKDESFKTQSIANRGRLVRKSPSSSSTTRVFTYDKQDESQAQEARNSVDNDEYLLSAKKRFEYYQFCVIGGKFMLALSGCCLLLSLIIGNASLRQASE